MFSFFLFKFCILSIIYLKWESLTLIVLFLKIVSFACLVTSYYNLVITRKIKYFKLQLYCNCVTKKLVRLHKTLHKCVSFSKLCNFFVSCITLTWQWTTTKFTNFPIISIFQSFHECSFQREPWFSGEWCDDILWCGIQRRTCW